MTLEEIRKQAREKLKGICGVYKICDGAGSRLCQNQSYGAPINLGGVGSGASFANNVSALAALRLRLRTVGSHFTPDTTLTLFGQALSMPVMGAAVSGVRSFGEVISEGEFCRAMVLGCASAGTMAMRGDTFTYSHDETPGIDAIAEAQGRGIKIIKPRDQQTILTLMKKAEAAGAAAVGVDVDGCGSTIMAKHNKPVFRKTADELRELAAGTSLPFIVKGVFTPEDARAAVDAGAKAVVVSNHGGRVLDHTPGAAEVLPAVVDEIAGDVPVLADGGIRTGFDVLKMLALGATAVLVGRDLVRAAVGGGPEGVRIHMEHLKTTLAKAMLLTGCPSLTDVNRSILS